MPKDKMPKDLKFQHMPSAH